MRSLPVRLGKNLFIVPLLLIVLAFAMVFGSGGPASAQDESDAAEEGLSAEDEQLILGSEVYSQTCASCHQAGGEGVSGAFPPLLDNPHVDDAAYVEEVINDGRTGPIEVAGETYDSVMPSFSTLSDDDKAAVIAFVQSGFRIPEAPVAEVAEPTGPVAGTELPGFANVASLIAYLTAVVVAGMVLAPRLIGVSNRLESTWLDAWMKAGAIVVLVALLTIFIPNWAMTNSTVAGMDRIVQDLVGVGLWSGGLLVVLGGLWYAHGESRI